jgi:hypothetical protein
VLGRLLGLVACDLHDEELHEIMHICVNQLATGRPWAMRGGQYRMGS